MSNESEPQLDLHIKSSFRNKVQYINEKVAIKIAIIFSSMWAFYAFVIWGAIPLFPAFAKYSQFVLLVSSSWIQLFALPLIAVANDVNSRKAVIQAKEDHENILLEFEEIKQIHYDLKLLLQNNQNTMSDIE